jgi:hypothetical protein
MLTSHPASLTEALETISEALFFEQPIPVELRQDVIALLVSRQVQVGPDCGFFIHFNTESGPPSRLFSGEQLHTEFARRHIQLIETARILQRLAHADPPVAGAIERAESRMEAMCYSKFCATGECKTISVAYMRYLASCDQNGNTGRLSAFLANLVAHHDGKGAWKGFPYFYTLLLLIEATSPMADEEIQYAAASLEKRLPRFHATQPYSRRRQIIIHKILSRS